MPLSSLSGTRLRERRLALGQRQADVAAAAGISPSYLNLIEHNRRKVTPELLERLASVLGIDRDALVEGREALLIEALRAAAARAAPSGAELDRLEDFVSRFPGWAALLETLHDRTQTLERAVEALNDRMNHDPHLSQALHEVLSSLSSVRSTAAILAETEDLPKDWAVRFHRNLHQDTERLATGAEALVAYLDAGSTMDAQGIAAPQEEVEDWLQSRGWSISDEDLATGLGDEIARLASLAARRLAEGLVERVAKDARLLQPGPFALALAELGPDPLAIAARFDASPLAVMRRLAVWPGATVGLVLCDASGTLVFRKPVAGFPLPRFGAACPLWPLYSALGRPLLAIETWVDMAGQGARQHRVIAWGEIGHPLGPRGPELREAGMLVLPAAPGAGPALAVGSSCRVCPRPDCVARREPSILSTEG